MRNIKILGLALMAMFAMSSLAAATASADKFTAASYPAQLTGSKDGTFQDEFVTTSGVVKCTTPTYKASIAEGSSSVTASAEYTGCTAFGFPAIIHMNECTYKFNILGGSSTEGDADLVCPAGKEVTVTAIGAGTVKCTIHVPGQADIGGVVVYTTIGAGETQEVTLDANLTDIDYTHTPGTGVGACTPGGGANNGTLKAKGVVTGEKVGTNTHVGVFVD